MGLLSAAVALAVAHLVAGFVGREASPVIAVGSTAIDLTPEWLKSFAIRTFGSNDKTVLLIGIGLVLAAVAAILGMASVRNRSVGMIGLAVFGLLGMVAAVTRPTGSAVDALPSLVGAVAGGARWSSCTLACHRSKQTTRSRRPRSGSNDVGSC